MTRRLNSAGHSGQRAESSPTSTLGQIQGLPVGEDPPERPGGLEGPFSPGHALSLPV